MDDDGAEPLATDGSDDMPVPLTADTMRERCCCTTGRSCTPPAVLSVGRDAAAACNVSAACSFISTIFRFALCARRNSRSARPSCMRFVSLWRLPSLVPCRCNSDSNCNSGVRDLRRGFVDAVQELAAVTTHPADVVRVSRGVDWHQVDEHRQQRDELGEILGARPEAAVHARCQQVAESAAGEGHAHKGGDLRRDNQPDAANDRRNHEDCVHEDDSEVQGLHLVDLACRAARESTLASGASRSRVKQGVLVPAQLQRRCVSPAKPVMIWTNSRDE